MVEVRSSTNLNSQLHYIRATKDGSIRIVANVVANGKSKLKFRPLVDVYNRGNTEDEVPISRVVRELENDSEMTQGSEVDAKTDTEGFDMTLQKVRKQCREKKRKLGNRGDTETVAQVKVKQEYSTLHTEDEECEVEEPLSRWNTKFSKRRKKKQECKSKCGSTSSPSAKEVDLPVFCDVKLEASWDELVTVDVNVENQTEDEGCDVEEPLSSWNTKRSKKKQKLKTKCGSTSTPSVEKIDLPVLCDVKPEASWDDSYLVPAAMYIIPTNPLLDSDKEPESISNKELVEEIVHDFSKDAIPVLHRSPEPNSLGIVAIEEPITTKPVDKTVEDASEEFIEARKAPCCLVGNFALENVLCGSASREEDELETTGYVKNLSYSNTSSVTEEVREDEESNVSKPNVDMITTGLEIMKLDAPEVLASLDMTIIGSEIVKADAPQMLATDISDSLTVDYGVRNTELVWEDEDIANDELHEATDILPLTSCNDLMNNLHSAPDDSTVSLEEDHLPERLQQSSSSGNVVDEAGDNKSSQLFQAPTDEAKTAEESDSIQQQELHSQPEKLLSGRKTLSPTSQANLCKAMEHSDSSEKMCKKSKGKLYFSSHNSHRILKAHGLDSIDRVEVVPNPKQAIRKAKINTRQTQYQRATNKFSRRDTQAAKTQPFSTGRTSLQGCTEKAIAFSQGQMRDFQYITAKLTKELKSMRQITKRCLLAESNPSIMPECNLDEVKTLIGKAEKTEESSKKWLSMIERDCNRFCKLMGMVKEDSSDTDNIVQKKKKIKFADDAGGDLCHVKVFEIDLESES
ncbi:unnamed protein product [Brassica rapa]|uniref:Uncharacterized protein n=2 Tax=Brassica TaxID=3705 RepID=A0A3P5Y642_BRACM|nr:unnamed protein product [Brassica napus]CAG7865766.1 unnamed protein product [Brassica rapa]VDC62816.1 unnamed protein product [Brassica rapa]